MSVNRATLPLWKRSNIAKWNVTNFRTILEGPYPKAKLTIPGLSHESFDIDGNAKLTSLMHTAVISRMYAFHKPLDEAGNTFLDWEKVTSDRFTFVSSAEFKMSRALYDREVPKWPLDAVCYLAFVGNSSLANAIEFYQSGQEEGEPLWSNINQLVSVDKTNRKPTPLPDWFKEKYKGKAAMDKGLIVKPFERPSVTYSIPIKVMWSDTDTYHHTNFASYARFAVDALRSALREDNGRTSTTNGATNNSVLQGITKEVITNGLKNVRICYLSESLEGQTLTVHVWQENNEENIVRCSVERGGEDICQLTLEYYK